MNIFIYSLTIHVRIINYRRVISTSQSRKVIGKNGPAGATLISIAASRLSRIFGSEVPSFFCHQNGKTGLKHKKRQEANKILKIRDEKCVETQKQ